MSALFRSLRWRLVIGLLIPLLTLRFISGYINLRDTHAYAVAFEDQALGNLLQGVITSVAENPNDQQLNDIIQVFEIMQKTRDREFFYQIRDSEEMIIAGDRVLTPIAGGEALHFENSARGERQTRSVAITLPTLNNATIQIANDIEELQHLINDRWNQLLTIQALLIGAIILVVHVVITSELRPLDTLRKEILRLRLHDLKHIEATALPSEIVPMVETLNELFTRLRADIKEQQSFFELASHQLKTPIAGMHNLIEVAQREKIFSTHPELASSIKSCLVRMQNLCEKLLSLLRVTTSSEFLSNKKPINIEELCHDTIISLLPNAEAKSIDLGFQSNIPATITPIVFANREALAELLSILVDNAIRYSPNHSSVTIAIEKKPRVRIIVEDQGSGIPDGEREKVFERFYRVLGVPESGSGLGLAIAREIAHHQNAKIYIENPPQGRGTRFVVEFIPTIG